jgi:hypothetical protein
MIQYFAEIKNDKVISVIVSTQKIINENYFGEWIETKIDNSIRKQYAGIGMSYNRIKDKFISKKPFNSWNLDSNDNWISPKLKPNDNKMYLWNEKNLNWELFN